VIDGLDNLLWPSKLDFQLQLKNLLQLWIAEIFEAECIRRRKSPGEALIGILEHLGHLQFVSQKEDASIFSGNALDFSYNGINDSGLVNISTIALTITS